MLHASMTVSVSNHITLCSLAVKVYYLCLCQVYRENLKFIEIRTRKDIMSYTLPIYIISWDYIATASSQCII